MVSNVSAWTLMINSRLCGREFYRSTSTTLKTFRIDLWNMKNQMHRTNNNIETWHRKFNCAFQCTHPNLWINELKKRIILICILLMGSVFSSTSKASVNKRLENLLENPHSNVHDELKHIGRMWNCFCFLVHVLLLSVKNIFVLFVYLLGKRLF